MSEEKDIEILEAELKALKKANIEREIALEKAKVDAAKKLEEEEKHKVLVAEIRQKILSEAQGESKIVKDSPVETSKSEYDRYFKDPYMKRLGLKGLKYEELLEQLRNKTYDKIRGDSR